MDVPLKRPGRRYGIARALVRTIVPVLLLAPRLSAQEVQLAPFVGLQFGGRVYSPSYDGTFSLKESLDYGATLDLALDEQWRLELLYSRQTTKLRSDTVQAPAFRQVVERYMVGIQEEHVSDGPVRFFGVGLVGATRFAPGVSGADSELRFAVGLSLGAKILASRRLAFRFEARGFYTVVESGGALYCVDGTCLFQFRGSGIWQGDVTGGLVLRF